MINVTLWKREIKANWKIFLLFLMIITLYSTVIVMMYDPQLGKSLEIMAASMPELFAAFGMSNAANSLIEFVTNYLYGFILTVIPIIFIILMAHRLVSRYIDHGSMAYLLATPNDRGNIIRTQAILMAFSLLAMVVYAMVLVVITGNLMFEEGIDIGKYFVLNIGLYGLLLCMGGLCFLSACLFNEVKYAIGIGAGCSIFFILIQMLSQVGDKVENLKYLTPFTLFQAEDLIHLETSAYMGIGILYAAGIAMFIIGIEIFKKRDLPL